MEKLNIVSLDAALNSMHRRPAIVLGPDATRAPGELARALVGAIKNGGVLGIASSFQDSDCRALIDKLRSEHSAKAGIVEEDFWQGIRTMKSSLDINHLAKAGWSACISLTEDLLFETALRIYLDSIPGTRTMTIVDRLGIEPPLRTVPIYKLLGNVLNADTDSCLALSEAEFLVRQQQWGALLQSFPDFVREAPVFLIGVTSCVAITRLVLGALLAMPKPRPTKLFFLKNEGVLEDPTIQALCRRFDTEVVEGTLRELCAQLAVMKTASLQKNQATADAKSSNLEQLLLKHSGIASLVPNDIEPHQTTNIDLPALLDGLFRPAALNWQPFLQKLDIRRASCNSLVANMMDLADRAGAGDPRFFIVRGEAGVGKTTLLKRVALELAQNGIITLWCARTAGGSWLRAFKALASDLTEWIKGQHNKKLKFAVVCDDPWGLRIDVGDLITCFDRLPAPLLFVFSARNSEFASMDAGSSLGAIVPDGDFEVPYELDEDELSQLGPMLVRIGAAKDTDSANREIARIPSRHAKDILCSLWYLVPETRTQLAESLRDEYCRLGSAKDAVSSLAETAGANNGSIAHAAYEFVTVTSSLNVGLPLEVLVHALGVNYDEWLETVGRGRPLWGLLYDLADDRGETVLYFTRNEVVTRVLLELVNGGVGHSGEYRVFKRLLSACSPGTLIYRNFALEILVAARKKLAEILSYEQGIELFEIAKKALPHEDRVIEHHKGIWMQDVGRDDEEAYRQFEKALATEVYPGAERDAPKEHIHTSMAAAIVKLIRAGKQDPSTGTAQVREHLRQASNPRFFNSHTSHVSASLLFDLARIHPAGLESEGALTNLVEALQEIEKARQIMGARGHHFTKERKNFELMVDLEKKILNSIPCENDLRSLAKKMFDETGTQVGMEVCARRLLVEAFESSKGKDFNKVNEYLKECLAAIENKQLSAATDLLVVRIDLIVRWLVQRFSPTPWGDFRDDLVEVTQDSRYRDDVIKNFYLAVAHYHCGDITEANAMFATLRRWQPSAFGAREVRCYFLNEDGNPRRFQGTFRRDYNSWHFEVPELNVSVLSKGTPSQGAGSVAHAYIGFSLNGPYAIENKPDGTIY